MAEGKIIPISDEDKERYKDKIKVFVAMPTHGVIHYLAHDNHVDMYTWCRGFEERSNYKFFTGTVGRLFTSFARETIAERALEGGMDYILWIDDDMMVTPDIFERLVKHDVDIVTPLTFMRVAPYSPVMWNEKITMKDGEQSVAFNQILEYPAGKLIQVGQVGFGVVLMKTSILKTIPKPWFFNNVSVGEDIWFSFKAKQNGFSSYVDTSFCVGHIGAPPIITEREFLDYKQDKRIKYDNTINYTVKGNV